MESVELKLKYEKQNVSILMYNKVSVILIGIARKCSVNPDDLMGMRASKNLVFPFIAPMFLKINIRWHYLSQQKSWDIMAPFRHMSNHKLMNISIKKKICNFMGIMNYKHLNNIFQKFYTYYSRHSSITMGKDSESLRIY